MPELTTATPTLTIPDPARVLECHICQGSGVIEDNCHECNGTGEDPDWDTGDPEDTPYECRNCEGAGTAEDECWDCNGYGHGDPHDNYEPVMRALIAALTPLAADGWAIDMGNWCCQSCAWAALDVDDDTPVVGFHSQDSERLAENGSDLYLFHNLPTGAHALRLVEALTAADLTVDWDGNTSKRIAVG